MTCYSQEGVINLNSKVHRRISICIHVLHVHLLHRSDLINSFPLYHSNINTICHNDPGPSHSVDTFIQQFCVKINLQNTSPFLLLHRIYHHKMENILYLISICCIIINTVSVLPFGSSFLQYRSTDSTPTSLPSL